MFKKSKPERYTYHPGYQSSDSYMKDYFSQREPSQIYNDGFEGFDKDFYDDMGYRIQDIDELFGRPESKYVESPVSYCSYDDCFS